MKEFDLTKQLANPTLRVKGEIFMEEQPDMSPTDSQPTELDHIPEASPKNVSKILGQEPNKLLEQPIPANKLKATSTEELSRAYLDLLKFSSSLEEGQTFGEKGETAAKFMPVNAQIINELQLRGVDIKKLFLQAVEEAVRRGSRIGSIGAADDVPGAGEPPSPPTSSGEPEGSPPKKNIIDVTKLTDPNAINLANQINLLEGTFLNERILEDFYKEALKLANVADRQAMLDSIGRVADGVRTDNTQQMHEQQANAEQQRFGFYLQANDLEQLRGNPTGWLDSQFNILYKFAQQGQELTSPIISNMQTVYSEAIRYLQYTDSKDFDQFQLGFTIRFHLIQNRVMIGHKNIEQIGEAARQLGLNGLLYAMSMENGKVGAMFNRMNEFLEDERLALNKEHHVTPELAFKLQKTLIDEQMDFARKGVSSFGNLKGIPEAEVKDDFARAEKMTDRQIKEDKGMSVDQKERIMKIKSVNADITRAVRTAHDVFVCSQRMGVIVARGRRLTGDEAYFSDPAGVFNVYNIEDLLWSKFEMYTAEQHEFVNRLKLAMAENNVTKRRDWKDLSPQDRNRLMQKWKNLPEPERLDLGRRLFRDIYLIPDFFTSGWRIKGITDSLQERFEEVESRKSIEELLLTTEEKAEYSKLSSDNEKKEYKNKMMVKRAGEKSGDFALFMRLKYSGKDDEKLIDTREIWKKIAKYRPDEIVRIFRERAVIKDNVDGDLGNLYQKMGGIDSSLLKFSEDELKRGVTTYDKFKERYGGALRLLREKALGNGNSKDLPFQLDIAKITSDSDSEGHKMEAYKNIANEALGEEGTQRLVNLFKVMQEDIGIRDGNGKDVIFSQEHTLNYEKLKKELADKKDQIKAEEEKWVNQDTVDLKEKEKLEEEKRRISEEIARFERDNFHDKINKLLTDPRFEDVYKRTLLVDDALLGELEGDNFRGNLGKDGKPFTKLSAKFSTDNEGDSLKRSWNDHLNAQKATVGLLQFITSEDPEKKIEGAKEFAARTSDYNGLSARVDCIRYTIGTLLDLSKKDYLWDLLAFEKGPLRTPISEMQRIMGAQAKSFSRDELRQQMDHLRELLTGPLSKDEAEIYQKMSPHDRLELREKRARVYVDLERVLEATTKDKVKMTALTFLIYLLLATGGEIIKSTQESTKN